jgi:hypothetical protein
LSHPARPALFDFDGTISTREMFPDFMRFAVAPRRLALGRLALAPLIAGYRIGLAINSIVSSVVIETDHGDFAVPLQSTSKRYIPRDSGATDFND